MANRIRNTKLASLLHLGAKVSQGRGFRPLHETARLCNRTFVLPAIERWLRCFAPTSGHFEMKVLPRHSVRERGGFNLFLSDIDTALVLKQEPELGELAPILAAYEQAKALIPFLGELEIYTETEWEKREQILKRYRKWIDLIWNVRKWVNQFKIYSDARTEYHRYKASISIQKVKRNLGVSDFPALDPKEASLAKIVDPYLTQAFREGPIVDGRSQYLLWDFERIPLGFLAILPDSEFSMSAYRDRISELRKQPEIGPTAAAMAAWERMLCISLGRIHQTKFDEPWQAHLSKIENLFPS